MHDQTEKQRGLLALGELWAPGDDPEVSAQAQLGLDLQQRGETQGCAIVALVISAGLTLPPPWGFGLDEIAKRITTANGRVFLLGKRQHSFEDARVVAALNAGVRYPKLGELVDYLEGLGEHLTVRDWYASPFTWSWCCAFRVQRRLGLERGQAERIADRTMLTFYGEEEAGAAGAGPLQLINESVRAAVVEGPPVPSTMSACYQMVRERDPLHLLGG